MLSGVRSVVFLLALVAAGVAVWSGCDRFPRRPGTERLPPPGGNGRPGERTAMSSGAGGGGTADAAEERSKASPSRASVDSSRFYASPVAWRRAPDAVREIRLRRRVRAQHVDLLLAGLRSERRGGELRVLGREEAWEEPAERAYDEAALGLVRRRSWRRAVARYRATVARRGPTVFVTAFPAVHGEIVRLIREGRARRDALLAAAEALRAGDHDRAKRRALAYSPRGSDGLRRAIGHALLGFAGAERPKRGRLRWQEYDLGKLLDSPWGYTDGQTRAELRVLAEGLGAVAVEAAGARLAVNARERAHDWLREAVLRAGFASEWSRAMIRLDSRTSLGSELLEYPD